MNNHQTTQTPRPLRLPPGQLQPQPAQPDHSAFCAPRHPQWSHFKAPMALGYNPQWMVPQSLLPPPPEQSAFYTNYDQVSQRHAQQHPYQQPQYHIPPSVAQPPPEPLAQPNHNLYHLTAGYSQQAAASPQPQGAYYPHLQPQQQQQRLHRTPPLPQDLRPAKRQRFDGPNLNRQAYHHAPPPLPAQNAGVYPGHSQGSGHGDGSYMDPGVEGRRAGQSGGGVRAHWSGGNFGGAASIQAEGRNTIPTSAEPAAVPAARQLHGAHSFSISGSPWFANIGTNTGNLTTNTVNHYGGTYGVSFSVLHRLFDLIDLNVKA
ncbi:hypothetical protein M378DRAFT_1027508 [Amanita muscaria Koide BX008]|uniref:Uncharacterized protein n=1 Tax=Amanita muscaria (strain Koide BX008) TaxID=946122 RepID=A0A0C2WM74_AMAMK|nr:hypothetical protein M378DRAFT_1027508 [Amanita muscaria Koide BX008]